MERGGNEQREGRKRERRDLHPEKNEKSVPVLRGDVNDIHPIPKAKA